MSWSSKYKKSIDCNNPKGFSQKAHCRGKKKRNESIMKLSDLKEEIRNIIQERSVNAISKAQQKNLDDIAKALEFYKKNKHTDKKEPFIKLLKKLGKEKEKLAKELDDKVSGMYKNAEYKGESVEESVNEALSPKIMKLFKVKKYVDDYYPYLLYYKGNMVSGLRSNSKKEVETVIKSLLKPLGIKESVNEMAMGFDSMTGLFYLKGVPFTRERVKEVLQFFMKSKAKSAVNQFEYTPSLIVKDKVGRHEVIIDPTNLKTLVDFYKKNSSKLASDKDF